MKGLKPIASLILGIVLTASLCAQDMNNIQMPELLNEGGRKTINVPDILGYITLKCDFHMHTFLF